MEMILVLEDAAVIRRERLKNPNPYEVDETTEDDVIDALLVSGASPSEVLRRKGRYTRALRIMLRGIDLQG